MTTERLIGWKEIASALRVSVSSARTYHARRPMPIKWLFGRPMALRTDIERWMNKCAGRKEAKHG
jgi:hypothetical protein